MSNIYFLTYVFDKQLNGNFVGALLGQWQDGTLVGGLAYYISPPQNFWQFVSEPIHVLIYSIFVVVSCCVFSRIWIDVSGTGSKDIARQLSDQQFAIEGMRQDSM